MAKMEAVLIANGLSAGAETEANSTTLSLSQPVPGTSTQANTVLTPSRKRHSSQQLGGASKDLRVCDKNRFEVLT